MGLLDNAVSFFYEHAGYSYDPAKETAEHGRNRMAHTLATAEERLKSGPYYVDHIPDDMPWDGDTPYDGPLWIVRLWSVADSDTPELLGCLGGVACESDSPYMRVVAAELAAEHIPA